MGYLRAEFDCNSWESRHFGGDLAAPIVLNLVEGSDQGSLQRNFMLE
jgi:hypothetical protein